MKYRVYIYSSSCTTASALGIEICNRAISTNSMFQWKNNEAANCMREFDVHSIIEKINSSLGADCEIQIRTPPISSAPVEYLCVSTSYEKAATVLPVIHCITAANDLVLYDAETKNVFFRKLVNRTFITAKTRTEDFKRAILAEMKPVWTIRKIQHQASDRDHDYSFVVTLRKDASKSFQNRCSEFYRCLSSHLGKDELLSTHNECFTVIGEWYSIAFCLEGYKKHPNQMGYYEHDWPRTKLIRRMGCDEAFRWLKCNPKISKAVILDRMNFREMVHAYPNPADRFIASVNISKWEQKQPFDIHYRGIGPYGSEILFHIVPSALYNDEREISVLAIEEDSASFILPFIHDIYPYFYERYYLEENHLPSQMWGKIIERLKTAREAIITDPYGQALESYVDGFSLFVLAETDDESQKLFDHNKKAVLFSHRFDIAHLYDTFIRWSEAQIEQYSITGDERMFNIQGP
ncbi:MAG: hypothetical protein ACI3XP_01090 [Eubacteriales bacterium]